MCYRFKYLQFLCAISFVSLCADDPSSAQPLMPEIMPEISFSSPLLQNDSFSAPEIITPPSKSQRIAAQKPETPFSPFTGKIKAKKVRLRLRPDTDSHVIKELNKQDLVSVVGEKGDFWAVEPPSHLKAYVFRSFVLDNVIEANHVNVRLEPSLDAPVIGHLNSGDRVDAIIATANNKWCEIAPPNNCRFYVAKDFVAFAGGPELKKQIDKRRDAGEELLETTSLLAKAELRKTYDEIDFNRVNHNYHTIIDDFEEFPELVEQAKEALASFQEAYLQQRITHLETASSKTTAARSDDLVKKEAIKSITDRMKMWEPIEQALYLSWASHGDKKGIEQFYEDQRLTAETVSGIVDAYAAPVKSKPGDFMLFNGNVPVAYLYSTQVNLNTLLGKQVNLHVSPRHNNNFAFPAYFVLGVE
jgi:hypothetical protein